jgi:iron complex transport system substrate-binding protein
VRAFALSLLLVLSAGAAHAAERVVSLNLCTDQLLVMLAPEKAVGLTPLSRNPALSFVAKEAARLPVVRPDAEAVLGLHPDLVLAGAFGAQTTVALLRHFGLDVMVVGIPRDFAGIRANTRQVARALGAEPRGEALLARMDAVLAGVHPPARPPRALVWEPRGYTAGPGSLTDAVLQAAGLADVGNGRRVGLEALVAHPPDVLVEGRAPDFPSLATALLQHPAVRAIPRRIYDPATLICGGPQTAKAVAALAE